MGNINKASVRMYCLGTGDCFVIKFTGSGKTKFMMMIDCGSCSGDKKAFEPYIADLASYVKSEGGIDLLVVTHEHQDHVNGFHKCRSYFEHDDFKIKEAWFAWTEDPADPEDRAADLQEKRKKMRMGFYKAVKSFENNMPEIKNNFAGDFSQRKVDESNKAFLSGLKTLADINLEEGALGVTGDPLAGMTAIKEILKENKKIKPKYLNPGEEHTRAKAPGLKFYILGPPYEQDAIFKNGKEGKDVYKKYLALNQNVTQANMFNSIDDPETGDILIEKNLPFEPRYIVREADTLSDDSDPEALFLYDDNGYLIKKTYDDSLRGLIKNYKTKKFGWRKIDHDWLGTAGSLAIRLNSHINNTSLALAIEFEDSKKVMLLPGDAEFGSWESWHLIKKWIKKGRDDKHLVEDLLKRTVFYKVGHHLSYNGTALEKGISMMPDKGMAVMVTLDRERISEKWKTTMPNKPLLQDLIKRSDGKVFIMNEKGIKNPPSKFLDPKTLKKSEYEEGPTKNDLFYKQFTFKV